MKKHLYNLLGGFICIIFLFVQIVIFPFWFIPDKHIVKFWGWVLDKIVPKYPLL